MFKTRILEHLDTNVNTWKRFFSKHRWESSNWLRWRQWPRRAYSYRLPGLLAFWWIVAAKQFWGCVDVSCLYSQVRYIDTVHLTWTVGAHLWWRARATNSPEIKKWTICPMQIRISPFWVVYTWANYTSETHLWNSSAVWYIYIAVSQELFTLAVDNDLFFKNC